MIAGNATLHGQNLSREGPAIHMQNFDAPDGHFKFPQARSVKLPHLKQDTDC